MQETVSQKEIDDLYNRLNNYAEKAGYHLNPDVAFTKSLVESLLVNKKRYGYMACPCRLVSGEKSLDTDIICPCDYRDADVDEYGMCYCALYVSQKVLNGELNVQAIPERRLPPEEKIDNQSNKTGFKSTSLSKPVWRCNVCGYLCGRERPPEVCPICKATKDRFEQFL